jgi:hypothetical protein
MAEIPCVEMLLLAIPTERVAAAIPALACRLDGKARVIISWAKRSYHRRDSNIKVYVLDIDRHVCSNEIDKERISCHDGLLRFLPVPGFVPVFPAQMHLSTAEAVPRLRRLTL